MAVLSDIQHGRFSRRRLAALSGGVAAFALASRGGRFHPRAALAQDRIALSIWDNRPDREAALQQLEAMFETVYPEIDLQYTVVPFSDYIPQLQSAVAAGQTPDVLGFVEGQWIRTFLDAIVDLGATFADNLIQPVRDQVAFDGGAWGCPLSTYTFGVFYNQDLFANLGLEPPRDWYAFEELCSLCLDQGVTPLMMPARGGTGLYIAYMLAASSILGYEGLARLASGERSLTDPDVLPAAELLTRFQPYYNADFGDTDYTGAVTRFAAGEAAMVIAGSDFFIGGNPIPTEFSLGMFGFPPGVDGGPSVTATGMDLIYSVSATSHQQDAAMAFIAWLASPDTQHLIADTIGLPVAVGIEPGEGLAAEIVAVRQQGADLLVWYDAPATANTFVAGADALVRMMHGELSPADAAALIQEHRSTAQA